MLSMAILAGGLATRLGEISKEKPKCLIEVNGRPFVDWQLERLIESGYSKFVFCVSHKSESIKKYLGDGTDRGIEILYSVDGEKQLGTGGALKKAIPLLTEKFGVIYGDSYLPIDTKKIENQFLMSDLLGAMTIYKNYDQFDKSNVEFEKGKILNYAKGTSNPKMKYIDYGLSYFRAEAFSTYPEGKSFDLSELLEFLVREQHIMGFEVHERFYEIGSMAGIEDFRTYLERKIHEF